MPTRARIAAATTIFLGSTAANLDASSVNVLLPSLAAAFATTPSTTIGIVGIYQLVLLVAVLPLASLGERVGFRNIYVAGFSLLLAGGVLASLAPSLSFLHLARACSGLATACIMTSAAAVLRPVFGAARIGSGLSVIAVAAGSATALGPLLAGFLLTRYSWRIVFVAAAPAAVCSLLLALRTVPNRQLTRSPFDWRSALMYSVALVSLLGGLHFSVTRGSVIGAACAFFGAAAFPRLIRLQRDSAHPILPLDLFRLPLFALRILVACLAFNGLMIVLATLPFHLTTVLELESLATGSAIAVWSMVAVVTAPLAGIAADREHGRGLGAAGLACSALGLILLVQTTRSFVAATACITLCG
ncbi:MAG TPA: MFS transporter [Steroidobacter sp.]